MTEHDDLMKELDAALDVEPSPAFADGVRAKVRRSKMRSTQMWVGLAAAAGIGFAVMALWRPTSESAVQMAQVTPPAVEAPAPAPTPEGRVFSPGAAPAPEAAASGGRVFRPGEVSTVRIATNTASEPQLEVITNQGAVLRQIWADVRGRMLVAAQGEIVAEALSAKPIEVDPIEVRPIVVSEIGKEPGSGGATPIIRRVNATKETK